MDWSELIKQQIPKIDDCMCFHAARLAQVLETYELFDLGVTINGSRAVITFELSPNSFINIYCAFRHPDKPFHFYHNHQIFYDQTLNDVLELINTNWSDIFNVKGP